MNALEVLASLGWVLLHSLWIGGLAAATLHLVLTTLHDASAHVRHLAAGASLCAVIVAVGAVAVTEFHPHVGNGLAIGSGSPHAVVPQTEAGPSAGPASASERVTTTISGRSPVLADSLVTVRRSLDAAAPWLGSMWIATAMVALALFAAGLTRLARLGRALRPLPDAGFTHLGSTPRHDGLPRGAKVVESPTVATPMLIGVGRPIIALPTSLRHTMSPEQLEAVVLHELEHVRRWDHGWAVLQAAILAVFSYHPAIRWISHHVSLEREARCDEAVISRTGDALAYGRALMHLVDDAHSSSPPSSALAAGDGQVLVRIRRLMGQVPPFSWPRVLPGVGGLAAACAMGVALAAMPAAPAGASGAWPVPTRFSDVPLADTERWIWVTAVGPIRFDRALREVETMHPGGVFIIEERTVDRARRLVITSSDGETLEHTYLADGTMVAYDEAARGWFRGLLSLRRVSEALAARDQLTQDMTGTRLSFPWNLDREELISVVQLNSDLRVEPRAILDSRVAGFRETAPAHHPEPTMETLRRDMAVGYHFEAHGLVTEEDLTAYLDEVQRVLERLE